LIIYDCAPSVARDSFIVKQEAAWFFLFVGR
jgi:hypothetical protein